MHKHCSSSATSISTTFAIARSPRRAHARPRPCPHQASPRRSWRIASRLGRDHVSDARLPDHVAAYALLDLLVRAGHALVLAQVLEPGFDVEGLDEAVRLREVLEDAP